jgi:thermitase
MHKIHELLNQKSEAYSKWHQHPAHSLAHWTVFIAAAVLITSSVVSQVNAASSLAAASQADDNGSQGLQAPGRARREAAQDHILVKFKNSVGQTKKAEVLAKHGLTEKSEIKQIGVKIININTDENTAEEVVQRLINERDVEFAELDNLNPHQLIPNDPSYSSQWERTITNAPLAWDITTGAPEVIVAIADTGVDCTHTDLSCVSGWNVPDNNSNSADVYGHGTAVAGTAAAIGNNTQGVAGQAWVKTMPIRVSLVDGSAYDSHIAQGIIWAADHGAKVVNVSYYLPGGFSINSAASYMRSKGGLVTVSEGNYAADTGASANNNIIFVSATNSGDSLEGYSSYGNDVDISAPGCVTTTANGGGYRGACGTSFASPMTAGTIALIFSANPRLTANQAETILYNSAKDLGTTGWDKYFGWGRIDAAAAVLAAQNYGTAGDTLAPSVPSNLSAAAVTSSQVNLSWSASTDNEIVAGYNVFRNGVKIATANNPYYSNTGLTANTSYTYSVSAFDTTGNTSALSNSVTATTPGASVSITTFSVSNKTTNSATVTWTTNIPSTGSISYGTSRNSLTLSATDGQVTTTHSVNLTNLNKGATYYYKIISTSQDGTSNTNTAVSSFKTARK